MLNCGLCSIFPIVCDFFLAADCLTSHLLAWISCFLCELFLYLLDMVSLLDLQEFFSFGILWLLDKHPCVLIELMGYVCVCSFCLIWVILFALSVMSIWPELQGWSGKLNEKLYLFYWQSFWVGQKCISCLGWVFLLNDCFDVWLAVSFHYLLKQEFQVIRVPFSLLLQWITHFLGTHCY